MSETSDWINRKANDVQVGGSHYRRLDIQPWDAIEAWGLGFLDGNAVKYLARWRAKGGIEDLRKARHYIDKLIELEGRSGAATSPPMRCENCAGVGVVIVDDNTLGLANCVACKGTGAVIP